MASDRAAIIAAADPRPSIESLFDDGELAETRGTALLGYLLSDDHLGLRRALGYHSVLSVPEEIDLDASLEEL
jgi:hypothetical protein